MSGSTYGTIFKITTWGESHGSGVGVVVDGCPAGLALTEEDIQLQLNRRRPGQSRYTTPRSESDRIHILSGIFEGKTTGTPIALEVRNETQRSSDYSQIASCYRPGHADFTFDQKYGFRDYRGGGRSSGRETIGRVAAGAIAEKILSQLGISVTAYALEIGGIHASQVDLDEIEQNPFRVPDASIVPAIQEYLKEQMEQKDSVGGIIECLIQGLPAGIGDPVFEKLDANLSKALMSIGSVKGVEIGSGFSAARSHGSENNDAFISSNGTIGKATNHAGGILGGISDGGPLLLRAAIKPTPSIASFQKTVTTDGTPIELSVTGRHDPIIVPRAVVVVETMAAITILDALLINMSSRMDGILRFYQDRT